MRKIRKSKFAVFVKKENGNYIAYSSMSGAVIVFNQDTYIKMLEDVIEKDIFEYQDDEFFNLMLEKKIFVDDFIDEVAEGAYNLDLGARGLKVVLDDVISPYLFEVYAGNIKKIHLKSSNDYKLKHELEENTKG